MSATHLRVSDPLIQVPNLVKITSMELVHLFVVIMDPPEQLIKAAAVLKNMCVPTHGPALTTPRGLQAPAPARGKDCHCFVTV